MATDDDVPITPISRPWVEAAVSRARPEGEMFGSWGNLTRDLNAACARAGVAPMTPNDLRRAFGSWHRDAGVSAELVSKLLRHTTDKLAQTTYAKLQAPALGELVSRAISRVPVLYAGDARNGANESERADDTSKNAGNSGATRGNRTPDLRFTKPDENGRSYSLKQGESRGLPESSVPSVYAGADSSDDRSDELTPLRLQEPDVTELRRALAAVHGDLDGRVLEVGS